MTRFARYPKKTSLEATPWHELANSVGTELSWAQLYKHVSSQFNNVDEHVMFGYTSLLTQNGAISRSRAQISFCSSRLRSIVFHPSN